MQYVVNALLLGGLYAVIAAGFSLVYGVMNVLNIAHGAFVVLGGYLTYSLVNSTGANPIVLLPLVAASLFGLGIVLQRYVLEGLRSHSIFMIFVFTFGLEMVLGNSMALIWSRSVRTVPSSFQGTVLSFGDVRIPLTYAIVFVGACLLGTALYVLLGYTRLGLAIQATALEAEGARLVGVNVPRIFAITFAISAALAGAAGGLYALVLPLSPYRGITIAVIAFAAAVLGGLGSVQGAMVAGVALAAAEVLTTVFLGAQFAQLTPYIVLLIVLVVRPQGLFGRRFFAETRL